MKYFILALLFVTTVFAQQYVQKQDTQIINILTNAGFESGKTAWIQTTPANVTVVSGTDALFGAASVKFEATSGTEIFRSALITIPSGLKGKECHAVVNYATNDVNDTPYVATVMDASGTVLATKDLDAKVVMGVPTDLPTSVTIDGWECPTDKQIQLRVENSALGDWVKLDNMHLGSKTGGLTNAADIISALGYTPADEADLLTTQTDLDSLEVVVDSVSGTVAGLEIDLNDLAALEDTHNAENLKKSFNLSDVVSAGAARSNLGLGDVAVENILPTTKGGTGVSSVTTGDILIASGTAWTKLAVGTTGQVLIVASGKPSWGTNSPVAVSAPTVQRFISGTTTWNKPTGVQYIKVTLCGGGGGGSGAGAGVTAGGTGGTSSVSGSTVVLTATGGVGGQISGGSPHSFAGGVGGTASVSGATIVISSTGGSGGGANGALATGAAGGMGAASPLGGAGGGAAGTLAGQAAIANSCSGGGGAGAASGVTGGAGGGAGGFISAIIYTPASSYNVTVGGGGAAGTGGTANAGAGGSGIVIVEEFY